MAVDLSGYSSWDALQADIDKQYAAYLQRSDPFGQGGENVLDRNNFTATINGQSANAQYNQQQPGTDGENTQAQYANGGGLGSLNFTGDKTGTFVANNNGAIGQRDYTTDHGIDPILLAVLGAPLAFSGISAALGGLGAEAGAGAGALDATLGGALDAQGFATNGLAQLGVVGGTAEAPIYGTVAAAGGGAAGGLTAAQVAAAAAAAGTAAAATNVLDPNIPKLEITETRPPVNQAPPYAPLTAMTAADLALTGGADPADLLPEMPSGYVPPFVPSGGGGGGTDVPKPPFITPAAPDPSTLIDPVTTPTTIPWGPIKDILNTLKPPGTTTTGTGSLPGSGNASVAGGLAGVTVGNAIDKPNILEATNPNLPQLGQLSSYQGGNMNVPHMADGGIFDGISSWFGGDSPDTSSYMLPSDVSLGGSDLSSLIPDDYMANGMGSALATDSPSISGGFGGALGGLWDKIKGADPKTVQTIIGALGALSSLSSSRHPTAQSVMGQRASLLSPSDSFTPAFQSALNTFGARPAATAVANPYGTMSPQQIAAMPQTGPSPVFFKHAEGGMAGSGTPQQGPMGALMHMGAGMVRGPGDGQSDDVNAKLANSEFVIPADVVSGLGSGSSDSGADALHAMMQNVREHVRGAPVTGIPPKSKSPLEHMHAGMKGKK